MISVHKLLQAIVPRFCWLLLRLHESLYSMNGVPVSICEPMMWSHSFLAGTTRRPRPSLSYLHYHQNCNDHCSLHSLDPCSTILIMYDIIYNSDQKQYTLSRHRSQPQHTLPFQCNIFSCRIATDLWCSSHTFNTVQ